MLQDARKLSCGNCGGKDFSIYQADDEFACECQSCKSVSILRATTPKIVIDWGEGSEGILCDLGDEREQ